MHQAVQVGNEVLKKFENQASHFKFKMDWKAVSMADKLNIASDCGETVSIDPCLNEELQRDIKDEFECGLCPYPA